MKSDAWAPRDVEVAIVGAGFAGTMTAVQLARGGVGVALIGRSGEAGKGVAYSTEDAAHLLNIPAAKMSAWPDQPDDFVAAIEGDGLGAEDYVPRHLYGRYLRGILDQAPVDLIAGEAVAAERSGVGWLVRLADGGSVEAKALVLAPGNQAPDALPFARGLPERLFAADPWGPGGQAAIARAVVDGGDVLVVGSGLSMVDVAMSLDAAGHEGRLLAVSRRGQMPRVSKPLRSEVPDSEAAPAGSLAALWGWVRGRAQEVEWCDAVDSVRPRTQELWQSLSPEDQRRFLRHARPWWDAHRHRIAPAAGDIVGRMMAAGRMEVLAGRVRSLREIEGGLEAVIRRRGASKVDATRRFAVGINCTGPLHFIARTRDPLLRSLLDAGLAEPDHLGIGIKLDEGARVAGAERLWAVGSLGKARYWEIIAVPDIRVQAAAVADDVVEELKHVPQSR